MLFLDGVYLDRSDGTRFHWVKAPPNQKLTQLAHTIAHRVGRFLERQGLLERDAENSYLSGDVVDDDPMSQLCGHSITYRIAVGPQAGRKVFTLQTLQDWRKSGWVFGDSSVMQARFRDIEWVSGGSLAVHYWWYWVKRAFILPIRAYPSHSPPRMQVGKKCRLG